MEYTVWREGEPAERSYPKKDVVPPADLALEEGVDSNQRIQQSVTSKVDFELDLVEMRQNGSRREELNSKANDRQLIPSQGTQNPFLLVPILAMFYHYKNSFCVQNHHILRIMIISI